MGVWSELVFYAYRILIGLVRYTFFIGLILLEIFKLKLNAIERGAYRLYDDITL